MQKQQKNLQWKYEPDRKVAPRTSRRGPVGRILAANGVEPESISFGHSRASTPYQRNRAWQAPSHCRYRTALCTLFQDVAPLLAGIADGYDLDCAEDALGLRLDREVAVLAA